MARLLPPESAAVEVVSREVGVSVATLERWRSDALTNGSSERRGGGGQRWTPAARLEAVIATAAMAMLEAHAAAIHASAAAAESSQLAGSVTCFHPL